MTTPQDSSDAPYLVTGASGFIAVHLIRMLLEHGHRVRGTLRRLDRAPQLRAALEAHVPAGERLEFVTADLAADPGWDEAVRGTRGVFHVASPVPHRLPRHEDEFIVPAREGALRVLKAAHRAKVGRVVLTSSVAAIVTGHPTRPEPYNEDTWSIADRAPPYEKSKTLAERAAWDWVRSTPEAPELVVINPSFVLGPQFADDHSPSLEIVGQLLSGKMPGVADLNFGLVDVRDVAQAHYAAMMKPEAAGLRFLCNNVVLSYREIATVLRDHLAQRGLVVPTRRIPSVLIRLLAIFNPPLRVLVPRLGQRKELDSTRLRTLLDWRPREVVETIQQTADDLLRRRSGPSTARI